MAGAFLFGVGIAQDERGYYAPPVRQFLEFIIRQLVEYPDEVMLSEIPQGRTIIFRLQMRQSDVGRIIGRNGQTIKAVRAILGSAAARHGQRATLDIIE